MLTSLPSGNEANRLVSNESRQKDDLSRIGKAILAWKNQELA